VNTLDYQGFKIYTYVGKPTPNEKRHIKSKMGRRFGQPPWWLEDNKYRTVIHNENFDYHTQIIFPEENTEEEKSRGLDKYGMIIQSLYPGLLRTRNINLHKQYCEEILHKITWRKQACYLVDGELMSV
jgi:hypothetical protein